MAKPTLPPPPPVNNNNNSANALPLPPRDRSRPALIQLKTHQRRHPLVIPAEMASAMMNGHGDVPANSVHYGNDSALISSTTARHGQVGTLKPVSIPRAPAAFLNAYNNANRSSFNECDSSAAFNAYNATPLPLSQPPPKANNTDSYAYAK